MATMLQEANHKMKYTKCECGSQKMELDAATFTQICAECGTVVEHSMMMTHTSAKGPSGDLEKVGTVSNMRSSTINYYDQDGPSLSIASSIHKKEAKMKNKLSWIVSQLDSDHELFPAAIDNALRIWRLCFDKKLTRGHESHQLAAILFYMACRQMQPPLPYLLLDFAAICKINVYKLAKQFNKLCHEIPIEINSLTDPSIYIARFANMLEFGDDTEIITATACKLIDQMKKDWITTGRRPSGVCGASLLIASRLHGYKRTLTEIVKVVGLSEGTIKKRVKEFLDTKIANMTVHSFHESTRQQINENANNRKANEQERPPIIKQAEKRVLKEEKIKEIRLKQLKAIQNYDDIHSETKKEKEKEKEEDEEEEEEDDDDIDALMKPEPEYKTVFVSALHNDVNDKREMDASSEEDHASSNEQELFTTARHLVEEFGSITSATAANIETETETDDNNESFIVGKEKRKRVQQASLKYHEDNDLSYLDDDPQVQSMLLDKDEIAAKDQFWMVCNPDWHKVKKDMDRKAMIKEEKIKSNKRKLHESFKDDPYLYVAGKVSKRFRSDKINIDVFHKLMGTSPSPAIQIKKDPMD